MTPIREPPGGGAMKAVNSLMIGFVVLVLAGCASTGASPRVPSGYIAETVDEQVPEGTVPAVVIEIDGQRAFFEPWLLKSR